MRRLAPLASFAAVTFVFACNMGPADKPTADKPAPVTAQSAAPKPTNGPLVLGEKITEKPVALSEVAKNPKAFAGKPFATSGTIIAVCQSMGCWMELKDDQSQAHVKLAGHSFFVPKTANGRKARVQATVVKGEGDEECKKEAAEQMGKPVAKLELEATGVELD